MYRKMLLPVFELDNYTEAKVLERTFDLIFENEIQLLGKDNAQIKCKNIIFPFARSPLRNVAIKNTNNLLESKSDSVYKKDIKEILLDCTEFKEFEWQPGDTFAILPINSDEDVDELLKCLELKCKADKKCYIKILPSCTKKTASLPIYIPNPTTPREILRDCLNLRSVLSKRFLRSLAEFCTDEKEKNFFKCISSKEGSKYYNDFILKGATTLVELLNLCDTCKPPLSLIIEHLPRLLPRPYSIANSPLGANEEMCFIFSILNEKPGVATKMLKGKCLEESSTVSMYLREPTNFRYTEDNYQQNQILIAIGTALAPFLGFLQHKQHLMRENKKNAGITWLFVGTATEQSVIHREQLLQWQTQNVLNNFVPCYSRTPGASFESIQKAIESSDQTFVEFLMKPETYLYVCADGGPISKSIEHSIQLVLAEKLAISDAQSIQLLKDFKSKGKMREDTWL